MATLCSPGHMKGRGVAAMVGGRESTAVRIWPAFYPFRVRDVRIQAPVAGQMPPPVDIEHVQIGHLILAAFASKHPLCNHGESIVVYVSAAGYVGPFIVEVTGDPLIGGTGPGQALDPDDMGGGPWAPKGTVSGRTSSAAPNTVRSPRVAETACKGCGAMNDVGITICYRCGNHPGGIK